MTQTKKISAAPSWLGLTENREQFVYLPERAEVVKRIFELAIGGMGSYAIAKYLDERKVPPFTKSESWDHTTIDYMLRNRATYGEYQPKSFAGGQKKGVPRGLPISNYYPPVIDKETFEAAQVARGQNLAHRGRKGNDLANLFAGMTVCGYCNGEVVLDRVANVQVLVCRQVLDASGCSRSSWTYRDFEKTVLAFLAHPALAEQQLYDLRNTVVRLAAEIASLPTEETQRYARRVDITVLLKQIVDRLVLHSSGPSSQRLPTAQIRKDVEGRFLDVHLADGRVYKCISL